MKKEKESGIFCEDNALRRFRTNWNEYNCNSV